MQKFEEPQIPQELSQDITHHSTKEINQNENQEEFVSLNNPAFTISNEVATEPQYITNQAIQSAQVEIKQTIQEPIVDPIQKILNQVQLLLETHPKETKEIIDKEIYKYNKTLIELQLKEQSFIVSKGEIELERDNRIKEKESLGNLLADLTREEKYTEAEILQQKLDVVSKNVENISHEFENIVSQINIIEQTKTDVYKDIGKLITSFNEMLNSLAVI